MGVRELLSLLAGPAAPYDEQFSDRTLRLARRKIEPVPGVGLTPSANGVRGAGGVLGGGGALGAAERLATDTNRVQTAKEATQDWLDAHAAMRSVRDGGRSTLAVAWAIDPGQGGVAAAFSRLDVTLDDAVGRERVAFTTRIKRARGAMAGVSWGTGLLGLLAAAATVWGVGERLAEYR